MDSLDAYMASLELPSGDEPVSMAQARAEHNAGLTASGGGPSVVVKNRRYRRMQQLLVEETPDKEDQYFSDAMMQQRSPALFHFYLGQYLGLDRSTAPTVDSGDQTLSSFLMDTCQRSEMERRRVAEQEKWGQFRAADEMQEQERMQRLYEEEQEEEEEEEEEEGEDPTPLSVDDRRQQLIEVMSTRFLNGEDSEYVNYAEIDADETLDDYEEMQRDAEERYFADVAC